MKSFLFFLLTLTLISCKSNNKSKSYKNFSYQFRLKTTNYNTLEDKIDTWVDDGRKISLKPYFHLFEDSLKIESIIKDSITTLGKIVDITTAYNFNLFLAKYIDQYLFIFVDKSKQSIINIFLSPPCSSKFKLASISESYTSDKGTKSLVTFIEVGQRPMRGYQKASKSILEVRYKLDSSAQIIFEEKVSDFNKNFHHLPKEHRFSGRYTLNTDTRKIELLVKDGVDANLLTFWLKILDINTKESIYRYGLHQPLSSNNTLTFSEKIDPLTFFWNIKLQFKNEEVEMIYNDCEVEKYKEIFCAIKVVLKKQ